MKKGLLVFLLSVLFLFTGCQMMESAPAKATREFLNKYKDNDSVIKEELDLYLDNEGLDDEEVIKYKELYLRQYSDLEFKIKDTTINGDDAIVTTEITVYDYYKANKRSGNYLTENRSEFLDSNGDIDYKKFTKYKVKEMLDTQDRVTYTLEIKVKKIKNKWEIEPLDNDSLTKIHGTYEY